MTQDELKALVGRAALDFVVPGALVGVGTGSTVNHFIAALAGIKDRIAGAAPYAEWVANFGRFEDLPGADVHTLADAGHWPHSERPAEFLAMLERCL